MDLKDTKEHWRILYILKFESLSVSDFQTIKISHISVRM